ncbi:hypothetical protein JTB14_001116 [Gonioctena quinquepunctata]|nr:hypothetical protein JTB14_001116 [Gonioctena quinquepunctata]
MCRTSTKSKETRYLKFTKKSHTYATGSRKLPIQTAETRNTNGILASLPDKSKTSWFQPSPRNMEQPESNPHKLWSICSLFRWGKSAPVHAMERQTIHHLASVRLRK